MNMAIVQFLPEITALFKKFGAKRAFLFGSSVSGELHEKSDADSCLVFLKKWVMKNMPIIILD